MVDCAVCRYWYERIEETRTHYRAKRALKQERRLMVALRTHQFGACARRFPELFGDLIEQRLETVSYTHLDVYKRQVSIMPRSSCSRL